MLEELLKNKHKEVNEILQEFGLPNARILKPGDSESPAVTGIDMCVNREKEQEPDADIIIYIRESLFGFFAPPHTYRAGILYAVHEKVEKLLGCTVDIVASNPPQD